jgi:hypothetical protein
MDNSNISDHLRNKEAHKSELKLDNITDSIFHIGSEVYSTEGLGTIQTPDGSITLDAIAQRVLQLMPSGLTLQNVKDLIAKNNSEYVDQSISELIDNGLSIEDVENLIDSNTDTVLTTVDNKIEAAIDSIPTGTQVDMEALQEFVENYIDESAQIVNMDEVKAYINTQAKYLSVESLIEHIDSGEPTTNQDLLDFISTGISSDRLMDVENYISTNFSLPYDKVVNYIRTLTMVTADNIKLYVNDDPGQGIVDTSAVPIGTIVLWPDIIPSIPEGYYNMSQYSANTRNVIPAIDFPEYANSLTVNSTTDRVTVPSQYVDTGTIYSYLIKLKNVPITVSDFYDNDDVPLLTYRMFDLRTGDIPNNWITATYNQTCVYSLLQTIYSLQGSGRIYWDESSFPDFYDSTKAVNPYINLQKISLGITGLFDLIDCFYFFPYSTIENFSDHLIPIYKISYDPNFNKIDPIIK